MPRDDAHPRGDETNLRHTVSYALRGEGYDVATADDGELALEIFRAAVPGLVVLDLTPPRMDGLAVCRAIRRESDVPVIMLTELDTVVELEVSADDYFTKPFSMVELVARIRARLRRTAPRHESAPARPRTRASR